MLHDNPGSAVLSNSSLLKGKPEPHATQSGDVSDLYLAFLFSNFVKL